MQIITIKRVIFYLKDYSNLAFQTFACCVSRSKCAIFMIFYNNDDDFSLKGKTLSL